MREASSAKVHWCNGSRRQNQSAFSVTNHPVQIQGENVFLDCSSVLRYRQNICVLASTEISSKTKEKEERK